MSLSAVTQAHTLHYRMHVYGYSVGTLNNIQPNIHL